MEYKVVKLEKDGNIAIITLNRPERLNALNPQITEELHSALDEVGSDNSLRAVIITGEGRGFCSGADVTGMRAGAEGDTEAMEATRATTLQNTLNGRTIVQLAVKIRSIPQPVIAAVNGVAAGAGLGIAVNCDMRVASDQARFASLFIKRSLTPDTGVSHMLPLLIGHGLAAEMALTGNLFDAHWAKEAGLVNKVVPHEKLMDEARALASDIAANPPVAVRITKQLLHRNRLVELQQAIYNESYNNGILRTTDDSKEAVLSFLEKRAAVFKGR